MDISMFDGNHGKGCRLQSYGIVVIIISKHGGVSEVTLLILKSQCMISRGNELSFEGKLRAELRQLKATYIKLEMTGIAALDASAAAPAAEQHFDSLVSLHKCSLSISSILATL